jgi:hypothetical protein
MQLNNLNADLTEQIIKEVEPYLINTSTHTYNTVWSAIYKTLESQDVVLVKGKSMGFTEISSDRYFETIGYHRTEILEDNKPTIVSKGYTNSNMPQWLHDALNRVPITLIRHGIARNSLNY